MGIEPFLVATSVHLICAQRLIRRICTNCKVEDPHSPEAMIQIGFTPEETKTVKIYKGAGCEVCRGSGTKGRCGLYEVLKITDELRELILVGASSLEIRRKAIEQGMITLRRSGLRKVMDGVAPVEEVVKETVL
jgi:type IV pilus assembly protein PilB